MHTLNSVFFCLILILSEPFFSLSKRHRHAFLWELHARPWALWLPSQHPVEACLFRSDSPVFSPAFFHHVHILCIFMHVVFLHICAYFVFAYFSIFMLIIHMYCIFLICLFVHIPAYLVLHITANFMHFLAYILWHIYPHAYLSI